MVKPGQVWENGKSVVKLQKAEESKLLAITFLKGQQERLSFSHANTFDTDAALEYVLGLGCQLTEKVLTIAS